VLRQVTHVHLAVIVGLRVIALAGRLVHYLRVDGHYSVVHVHQQVSHHKALRFLLKFKCKGQCTSRMCWAVLSRKPCDQMKTTCRRRANANPLDGGWPSDERRYEKRLTLADAVVVAMSATSVCIVARGGAGDIRRFYLYIAFLYIYIYILVLMLS